MVRGIRIALSTISMYVFSHVLAFLFLPIGLLIVILDREKAPKLKKLFTKMLFGVVGKRVTAKGEEWIEEGQKYLVVANYPSFYAGFALMNVFPTASIVAHAFISRIPILSHVLRQVGVTFVDPKKLKKTKGALDKAFDGDKLSHSVIIFPEGERTPDGKIGRFRRGFVYILRQSYLYLLPVTLNGYYSLKPMKRLYYDPEAVIEMIIHKPISNEEVLEMSDKELLATTAEIIENGYRP